MHPTEMSLKGAQLRCVPHRSHYKECNCDAHHLEVIRPSSIAMRSTWILLNEAQWCCTLVKKDLDVVQLQCTPRKSC